MADKFGVSPDDVEILHSDTAVSPIGLDTYGSRSLAVGGVAVEMAADKVLDKARRIAAHQLEASADDLEFVAAAGEFRVKGTPTRAMPLAAVCFEAFTAHDLPDGMEPNMSEDMTYDPPNFVFPYGTHVAVVEVDTETGHVKLRGYTAVDDCGVQINPMIVEGQVHGGLTMGFAPALYEEISYDEIGNVQGGSFIDYLVPTAVETPKWETGHTVTPSPHHPLGAKGVGESATVGAPAAIANAVVDALWHLGVRHVDIPITPYKVWKILRESGVEA
jgi:carbon-monoxide dehydrogenase large subunit